MPSSAPPLQGLFACSPVLSYHPPLLLAWLKHFKINLLVVKGVKKIFKNPNTATSLTVRPLLTGHRCTKFAEVYSKAKRSSGTATSGFNS